VKWYCRTALRELAHADAPGARAEARHS